jgi:DNA-binding CsgD family transcriptional regulator
MSPEGVPVHHRGNDRRPEGREGRETSTLRIHADRRRRQATRNAEGQLLRRLSPIPRSRRTEEKTMKKVYARDLSDREMEILKLTAEGMTNKEIARELKITEPTVKVHMKAVLRKLQAGNRTHGVVVALRAGIVPLFPERSEGQGGVVWQMSGSFQL